jgi:hypothetical protein
MRKFFERILAAKNGDLSSTRLCLLSVTAALCLFVFALVYITVTSGEVPEVPNGTGLFLGGLVAVIASLKGVQNKQEENGESK